MADLGSFLMGGGDPTAAQPPSDTAPADPKSGWMSWAQNPVNNAALLSFGLQMLTGGWGNNRQQIAQAIGAGAEGASGAEAIQQKEADTTFNQNLENRKLSQQKDLELQKEAGALERTKLLADSRKDVANIRTGSGQMDKYEQTFYNKTYTDKLKTLSDAATLGLAKNPDGSEMSAEDINAAAAQAAEEGVLARRSLYGGASRPTSQATLPAPGAAGTTPPATPSPAPAQGTGAAPLTYDQLKAQVNNPNFDAWARTPQGKAFLQSRGITAPGP